MKLILKWFVITSRKSLPAIVGRTGLGSFLPAFNRVLKGASLVKTSLVRIHTHVPTSYSRQRYRFSIAIFQLCACILSTLLDLASDYHQHFNYFLPKKVQAKARHADKSNIIVVSLLDRLPLLDKKKCVWHGL